MSNIQYEPQKPGNRKIYFEVPKGTENIAISLNAYQEEDSGKWFGWDTSQTILLLKQFFKEIKAFEEA